MSRPGQKSDRAPATAPPRLYDDLAWLWPHLSPPEHYEPEAQRIDALIAEHLGGGPRDILELGAGGGHTLVHLAQQAGGRHRCVAVDLSEPMLEHCRRLIPGIETHVADMRTLDLYRTFDAVLVHDAIDYLRTEADVAATLGSIRRHLRPGGLAVIAPTYTRETFVDGDVADDGTTVDDAELTFFTFVHDPDPADTEFEMILIYLIRDARSRQVELIEDRHACGLFGRGDWLRLLDEAGLETILQEDDAGAWSLFLARRPD